MRLLSNLTVNPASRNAARNAFADVFPTRRTNRLLAGPDIVSRGFVYVRESEQLMEDARKAVSDALDKCLSGRHTDWNKIKLTIRDAMNDYIWKKTKRRPMVIPIIMDIDV